jgi:hypothetical protein
MTVQSRWVNSPAAKVPRELQRAKTIALPWLFTLVVDFLYYTVTICLMKLRYHPALPSLNSVNTGLAPSRASAAHGQKLRQHPFLLRGLPLVRAFGEILRRFSSSLPPYLVSGRLTVFSSSAQIWAY